jgi:hypothetical protein
MRAPQNLAQYFSSWHARLGLTEAARNALRPVPSRWSAVGCRVDDLQEAQRVMLFQLRPTK